jgi:NAD(P)-dependent dehydrogenase (short-subunit alcohol dehydrogenase family)
MQDLVGKTAFVTGGASGIGLALGRAFAEASMNVTLADIEAEALTGAVRALQGTGPGAICSNHRTSSMPKPTIPIDIERK